MELTDKQKRFADEYLVDYNATQAAMDRVSTPKALISKNQVRKFILFALLITSCVASWGQLKPTPVDSIPSFSYMLFRMEKITNSETNESFVGVAPTGTCFFIKWDTSLFLVTAKHVLTPCCAPCITGKDSLAPSFLYTRVSTGKNAYAFLEIDLRMITDSVQCLGYTKEPDVFVLPIKVDGYFSVNSIEGYLMPNIRSSMIQDTVYGAGFPAIDDTGTPTVVGRKASLFKAHIEFPFDSHIAIGDSIDPFVYYTRIDSGVTSPGGSGSPVFMKERNTDLLWFGGVVVRGNRSEGRVVILKPDEVLIQLNERLKQARKR
ncbi:MAG TPA: terminase small subunit [Chitinophagaceae bacterium]|nr:terminase small subunit [Chitinophagaceae bacterium]